MDQASLRQLPSVDYLLKGDGARRLVASFGRRSAVEGLRAALDWARREIQGGGAVCEASVIVERAGVVLESRFASSLRPVINATGVILHTNLGRAPLSDAAREAVAGVGRGYSTLEYDLGEGRRGHRFAHVEELLCRLTGAESALVVNNNAGAVLLALGGLARGRGVLISRGQLVEIGGGFRVPDVMEESGAVLKEVGTTNRTHLADYEGALTAQDADVALILRAHHSNFRILGFSTEPAVDELATLGNSHGVPVIDDLGSGALLDTAEFGLMHEPTVQESIKAGAAVVCFSGDKLLGGPQAGIIVGGASWVDPLKQHPLARALRADKLCLAALQATLLHYAKDEAMQAVPVWQMISAPRSDIVRRARNWRRTLRRSGLRADLADGESTVGGGSLPGEVIPTTLVLLQVQHPDSLVTALREGVPPVVARIEEDKVVLDPRTVLVEDDRALLLAVVAAAADRQMLRQDGEVHASGVSAAH